MSEKPIATFTFRTDRSTETSTVIRVFRDRHPFGMITVRDGAYRFSRAGPTAPDEPQLVYRDLAALKTAVQKPYGKR